LEVPAGAYAVDEREEREKGERAMQQAGTVTRPGSAGAGSRPTGYSIDIELEIVPKPSEKVDIVSIGLDIEAKCLLATVRAKSSDPFRLEALAYQRNGNLVARRCSSVLDKPKVNEEFVFPHPVEFTVGELTTYSKIEVFIS
jgi:hypothetical protein